MKLRDANSLIADEFETGQDDDDGVDLLLEHARVASAEAVDRAFIDGYIFALQSMKVVTSGGRLFFEIDGDERMLARIPLADCDDEKWPLVPWEFQLQEGGILKLADIEK